jgi:uncharacterized protein YyaL (SSP411 family)
MRRPELGAGILILAAASAAGDSAPQEEGAKANRLAAESSPYLLAHASDPVDWYPWGEEAFARARAEDKPIFLSIGYSTCHWCHVMQRESFQDEEIAALLNVAFVCVKVDREERPDVDHLYMTAGQLLTGGGGWPLTIIMTPAGKPFFAGTYFPPTSRFGRVGLRELVPRLAEVWRTERDQLEATAAEVTDLLGRSDEAPPGGEVTAAVLAEAYRDLAAQFDGPHGGFGGAPKFPAPANLYFLLRYHRRTGDARALEMVETSLRAMRYGGLYDHLGFGFHRYATDASWRLPHFEKMLYDQALLAIAYAEAYQVGGDELFRRTAEEVFEYVRRDLTSPEGAFYAAEDADSEGEEGKFYLWTEAEIRATLAPEEAAFARDLFGAEPEGNFAEEASGVRTGRNVLYRDGPLAEGERARLEAVRRKLFEARAMRVRPRRDEKILADWNGLMIASLAFGARAFDEPEYAAAATRAADFFLDRRAADGRLAHRYAGGEGGEEAFLDDYAFLTWGLIELYETTAEAAYLRAAVELTELMLADFGDERGGGFYFASARGASGLIARRKEFYDGAVPSGNAVAFLNLLRLGRLTGEPRWEEGAAATARALAAPVARAPAAYMYFLAASDFALGPAYEVVVVGDPAAEDTRAMRRALGRVFRPNATVVFKSTSRAAPSGLPEFAAAMTAVNGRATAYVCDDFACRAPTTDVDVMLAMLKGALDG